MRWQRADQRVCTVAVGTTQARTAARAAQMATALAAATPRVAAGSAYLSSMSKVTEAQDSDKAVPPSEGSTSGSAPEPQLAPVPDSSAAPASSPEPAPAATAPAQQEPVAPAQQDPAPAPAPAPDATPGQTPVAPVQMAAPSAYQPITDRHNTYRARHQAAALTWSDTLGNAATSYASRCNFAHDPYANAGENLFATSDTTNVAGALIQAIDAWCDMASLLLLHPGFEHHNV